MAITDPALVLMTAFRYCVEAHGDQRRRDGTPYIAHPVRVASVLQGLYPHDTDAVVVALMHDVIEDGDLELSELHFTPRINAAIEAITQKPHGETYFEYIHRCAKNPLAARVKLFDLQDNLMEGLRDPKLHSLTDRYRKAIPIIEAALGIEGE